jgi:hypothetical protein
MVENSFALGATRYLQSPGIRSTIMDEIDPVKQTIALLKQRPLLGDAVVDTALPRCENWRCSNRASRRAAVVTVLCRPVGFTAFSERMDPEDVREIVMLILRAGRLARKRWRCGGERTAML